jgi:hypothetical protein
MVRCTVSRSRRDLRRTSPQGSRHRSCRRERRPGWPVR